MRRARAAGGLALFGLACAAPAAAPAPQPALVALELLRGFDALPAPREVPRAIALLDATRSMAGRDTSGVVYFDAARAAAQRWLGESPAAAALELRALGGERSARCDTPARAIAAAGASGAEPLFSALDRLSAAGEGSLAAALLELADEQPLASPARLRVVAWSALRDGCDASLCDAAAALARRGVRLDLVVLGDAPVPACLAELRLPRDEFESQATQPAVGFRIERLGPEPAVIGCSESGGLPVAVPLGAARMVVALDPPLVLERSFPPETRWVLEILDFPALGPGERQWRWRPFTAADAGRTPR